MVAKATKEKKVEPIHDEAFVKEHQKELVFDEYTLRPDERTKEQVADKAGVTPRAVEIWKSQGKIEAEKLRRRVDGVVRKQLIFKIENVEKFLSGENEPVKIPKLEKMETEQIQKTNENEQLEFLSSSQMFVVENLGKFADAMNNFTERTAPQLPEKPESPFLSVKEAVEFTLLSENCLRNLVKAGTLGKFTGDKGKLMFSRKQLLNL